MAVDEGTILLLASAAAGLVASVMSLVPALHVYNVGGLVVLFTATLHDPVPSERLAFFFLGLVTGYAMLNAIPAIYLAVPDDSTLFIVRPGQKYLRRGRGYEAVVLTGVGGLCGIAVLAVLTPVASSLFPALRAVLQPHLHWILWAVVAFMLISEWPKGSDRARAGWRRWWEGWRNLVAGLVTFLLSGILGHILLYRTLVPMNVAYQNLQPAFAGLFAVPWILQTIVSRAEMPPQHVTRTLDATPGVLLRGAVAGVIGGLFAAFFPVVTGGIGGLIAGHATAQRDDRLLIISQGVSKAVYYVGGLLLFFVPGLHLIRGGMASMLGIVWSPRTPQTYYLAVAAVLLTAVISFFLLLLLARTAIKLITKVHYRWISLAALAVLLALIAGTTGWNGLLICTAATGIGLIPVLWGSRRTNCVGVLLLPIALNMVGLGSILAKLLGLVE